MTTHNTPTPAPDERPPEKPLASDQFLDLLLDALTERQRARQHGAPARAASPAPGAPRLQGMRQPQPVPAQPAAGGMRPDELATPPQPGEAGWQPPAPVPSVGLGRTIWRTLLAALLLTVLFNIPITRHGVSLARILPDAEALVIRDGLLLKGPGPEVYVLQDDHLRWISSLEAFERLGYEWDNVHAVDEAFLSQFEPGKPVYVLLKCPGSPHIYRIERDEKRWIKDIATFEAEGHVWEDVHFVDCEYLDALPVGPPIPEDAGAPPER
jgi:hypothetical protein